MPTTATVITAFLASPSDLDSERLIVSNAISEWNGLNGRGRGARFELLKWEDTVPAGFGADGQSVINNEVSDSYDLLIVLMWSRLGTATPRSSSGTVEEYERALIRYRNGEQVEIALLFKDAPVSPRQIDLAQLSLVMEFEKKARSDGAFSKTFNSEESLKFEVNLLLDRSVRRFVDEANDIESMPRLNSGEIAIVLPKSVEIGSQGEQSDLGIYDVTENMTRHSSLAVESLSQITNHLIGLTEDISSASSKLTAMSLDRPIDGEDAKPIIMGVAASMDSYSSTIETVLPTFSENSDLLANDVRLLIDITYDFIDGSDNQESPIIDFRSILEEMVRGMNGSVDSVIGMRDTVKGLQRTTSSFNKAKRRLVNNLDNFINVTLKSKLLIEQAIVEVDALLSHIRKSKPN